MKAAISNRIYLQASLEQRSDIRRALTYEINEEVFCDVTSINPHVISIPVGRTDLVPTYYSIVDNRKSVPAKFSIKKQLKLKKSQEIIIRDTNDNTLIVAEPGWGKTFTGLCIAEKLQQKTLVVVHTVFLRDQWVEEVENLFGWRPSIIGSGTKEWNKPITIANIQTLTKMFDKIANEFGLIIMDEVHHMPASTFKKVLDKAKAKYKIGLTGTLGRKDGKHVYITDYFSRHIQYPDETLDEVDTVYKEDEVTVIMHDTGIKIPGNFNTPWSIRLNKLYKLESFKNIVCAHSLELAQYGHKVLTVADRTEFLSNCAKIVPNSEVIIGTTSDRDKVMGRLSTDVNNIFGTTSIFKEGISENILGGLVIAVPLSNVFLLKQLTGRVLRIHPNKIPPVVVDLVFSCNSGKSQAKQRLAYYKSKGYNVIHM